MRSLAIRTTSDEDREEQLALLAASGRYAPGIPLIEIRRIVIGAVDGRPAP